MPHGYNDSKPYDASNLEDEFLCEYVDGTMDPLVRHVFEEYVQGNPGMQEHIERLRSTRRLLCRYACRRQAPGDLHHRLRNRIPADPVRPVLPAPIVPVVPGVVPNDAKGTVISSYAVMIVLMLGLVLGASGMRAEYGSASSSPVAVSRAQDISAFPHANEMLRRSSHSSVLRLSTRFSRDRAWSRHHARSIVTDSVRRELRARTRPGGSMVSEIVYLQ